MAEASLQTVRQAGEPVVWTAKPMEVLDGIFVTGEIPRQTPFEDTGGPFFLDEACAQADPLADDQALFFDTKEGLVVLLGCAHAGVVNTLLHVQKVAGGRPISAVVGGFHLLTASDERQVRPALERGNVERVVELLPQVQRLDRDLALALADRRRQHPSDEELREMLHQDVSTLAAIILPVRLTGHTSHLASDDIHALAEFLRWLDAGPSPPRPLRKPFTYPPEPPEPGSEEPRARPWD